MILVIAATELEMQALRRLNSSGHGWVPVVTGVGLAATAQNLTAFLCKADSPVEGVINFGVGGAYVQEGSSAVQPRLLDICVAEREVFGDLGVSSGDSIEYLSPDLTGPLDYRLDSEFALRCLKKLDLNTIPYSKGTFISVNAASGRRTRGRMLQKRWGALCENMEGAAAARVCGSFSLPFFELRCISNMVVDRDPASWMLAEACEKAARVTAAILKDFNGA